MLREQLQLCAELEALRQSVRQVDNWLREVED
jgi:hypothetical protein